MHDYDVLVVGAGPAGSSAAWALARAGLSVALVDQQRFPRDKVCGDALIPDALGAIDALGLRAAVDRAAVKYRELRVVVPNGNQIHLHGDFACVPRLRFDALILDAAVNAGARPLAGVRADGPLVDGDRVAGARVTGKAGPTDLRARLTLLATGANATALSAFGVATDLQPTGVAGRVYYRVPDHIARDCPFLLIAYHRSLCPGYGWIFPGPDNRFNLGVGASAAVVQRRGLRTLWHLFLSRFEPAAALVRESEPLSEFRGAPLRTGLQGARLGRLGLLVLGEAAGTTYPFSGEGIGKAMESGLLAAELAAEALEGRRPIETLHLAYASAFHGRFLARCNAYRAAQRLSARPWLLNLLAWRANGGRFVRAELEALIAETGDPRRLFSAPGLARALLQ